MPAALDEEISQGIDTNVEQVLKAFEPHSGFRDEGLCGNTFSQMDEKYFYFGGLS
jgi:hypothetical protein